MYGTLLTVSPVVLEDSIHEVIAVDKVKCPECGGEFSSITTWHLKKHGMSWSEFRLKYPDYICRSVSSKSKQSQSCRAVRDKFVESAHKNLVPYSKSESNRKRASEFMTSLNKSSWEDPKYREMKSVQQREVLRRQVGDDPEFRSKAGRLSFSNRSDESKIKHIERSREHALTLQGNYKGRYVEIADKSYRYLRSSWEYVFYKYLECNNIYHEYESLRIRYYDEDGHERVYVPDFITESIIYEIKGYPDPLLYKKVSACEKITGKIVKILGYEELVSLVGLEKFKSQSNYYLECDGVVNNKEV